MDTVLAPMMDDLRVSLAAALTDTSAGKPCVVTLQHGPAATADWCGCDGGEGCGMGWVRLDNIYPSGEKFPSADTRPGSCAVVLAAVIEVGAYRCAPVSAGDGTPPSPADQTQGALDAAADALAMVCAVRSTEAIMARPSVLGRWTAKAGGDCQGGALTVTVQLTPRPTPGVRPRPNR